MPDTAPRYTVQTVLDFILQRDRKHEKAETVYELNDFAEAADRARMVAHLEGKPFHMAADLLGVSPALLSGILSIGADSEEECSYAGADPLEREALAENTRALRAASAMYEAENPKAVETVGPQTRNDTLADKIEALTTQDHFEPEELAVLQEAAQRIRERGDEEEG